MNPTHIQDKDSPYLLSRRVDGTTQSIASPRVRDYSHVGAPDSLDGWKEVRDPAEGAKCEWLFDLFYIKSMSGALRSAGSTEVKADFRLSAMHLLHSALFGHGA
ncbi:hypothetical protein CHS0354_027097 [Potamilus streckersoni]|uniref:Uncharacterized protein n=1 Tax=Potamilus streckersoni TaxID=2493646 RepID=A0AAE0VM40_9BIVA|nr:hypothetical protein CHS0354_027097 [Potamilus streckersoni]